ncbi:MAG: DUF459 domain-containing protein [Acidimicrobiales bacterium]
MSSSRSPAGGSSSRRTLGGLAAVALTGLALGSCGAAPSEVSTPLGSQPAAATASIRGPRPRPTTTTAPPSAGPVLEVGDSLGIDLGWGLADELTGIKHRLIAAAVGDTGLAEPSYYDWPAQLAVELRLYHPATVVVFLGANDVEGFYTTDRFLPFGSPGWAALYGKRVAQMMDEATSTGAKVLWVGMPPMESQSFSSDMATLNAVYRTEAIAHRPDVSYLASWRLLGGPHGQYRESQTGVDDEVALRAPDGVHITRAGGDLLAKAVIARLKRFGWL